MTRFYFRIYQAGDPDGSNIWVDAENESEQEARNEVFHEYWGITSGLRNFKDYGKNNKN